MQPEVETVSALERRVDVVVPTADIEKEVLTQLRRVARTAKVQGFRPGKAPLSIIERSHGAGIRYDVVNTEIGRRLETIIQDAELRIAGAPSLEAKEDATNEEQLAFTATFEVYPEVDIPDISKLEVTRVQVEVGDDQVQKTIDILRKQRAEYEVQEGRAAQASDRVTLDFAGKIDGEPFDGGSAEGFSFELGEGRMLPEFEEAVTGMKAGESKTFPLSFPEDYGSEAVAGKTAEFEITVKEVAEAKLPELDADFARTLGQEDGDIDKLLADIRTNIEREVKARANARTKNSALEALAKASTFELPKALVSSEAQARIEAAREELKQRGVPNAEDMPIPEDAFAEEAERRVRLGLLLSHLVKAESLQAKDDQVRERLEEFAKNYEEPAEVVSYYLSDPQRRAEIEAVVIEDNVVAHVLSKATVSDESVPFDDIMGTN